MPGSCAAAISTRNGSDAGTYKIFEEEGNHGSINLLSWNGAIYFWSWVGDNRGLWRTDGTIAGTVPVKKFDAATSIYSLVASPATLYFMGGVVGDMHIWKSDGSTAGTIPIINLPTELNYDDGEKMPGGITIAGQKLFFTVSQTATGRELWVSDGTQAGTHITKDLTIALNGSWIRNLTAVGERVFFMDGISANYGLTLGVSDGTEVGTKLIQPLAPNQSSIQIINYHDQAIFTGSDSGGLVEPWISNGTEAGTQRLKDINEQASPYGTGITRSSSPFNLVLLNDKILFTADDGIHGRELWLSDGTEAGTQLLLDRYPGPLGSAPGSIVSFGSIVIFAASNGPDGVEVWRTDGTVAGTTQLADVAPEPGSSNPFNFTRVGNKLFFMADDGSTGVELHMLQVDFPQIPATATPTRTGTATPTNTTSATTTPTSTTTVTPTAGGLRYRVYLGGIVR